MIIKWENFKACPTIALTRNTPKQRDFEGM